MANNNDQLKLSFIKELLEVNPEVKAQFAEYVNAQSMENATAISVEDTERFIKAEAKIYQSKLEEIDLDNPDWENYVPRDSGYIPEYEAMEHVAEDLIDKVFSNFKDEIIESVKGGKTSPALLKLIAIYNACLSAEIADEYETIPELPDYLLGELDEVQIKTIDQLGRQVASHSITEAFLLALLKHYQFHYRGDEHFLRFFEPTLLALVNNEAGAALVKKWLDEYKIQKPLLPRLFPQLSFLKKDWTKWTKEAEELMEYDAVVAKNLLNYYINESYADFIRVANKLWSKDLYINETARLYFEHIDPQKTPQLYRKVVRYLTETERTEVYYSALRKVLSESEKEKFIRHYTVDGKFYAMMLDIENRHTELLDYIESNSDAWDFIEFVPYLFDRYPQESLRLIAQNILGRLQKERGRRVYHEIVELLKAAQNIKNQNGNLKQLILEIYHWKPSLPALRDEMRKVGVV